MKIEDQVCSLQQSKKLKELGVIQDSLFYHFPNPNTDDIKKKYKLPDYNVVLGKNQIGKELKTVRERTLEGSYTLTFSAFTVAELGVMLPEYYPSWRFVAKNTDTYKNHKLSGSKKDIRWITTVITKDKVKDGKTVTTAHEFDRYGLTEAKSRAMLLIALLENEVIKVSDVNKRLTKK